MSNTTAIEIECERFAVIRQDHYELPCVHLITEAETRADEPAELVYVEVSCECWGYYDPGRLSGPPEDCYPPEGDFEVQDITMPKGMEDYKFELTESEQETLEQDYFSRDDGDDDYDPQEWDDYDDPALDYGNY